jgi:hypothetical protein
MSLMERVAQLTKALLTTDAEMSHLRPSLNEIKQELSKVASGLQDVREKGYQTGSRA